MLRRLYLFLSIAYFLHLSVSLAKQIGWLGRNWVSELAHTLQPAGVIHIFLKMSYLSFIDMLLVDLTSFFLLIRLRASSAVAANWMPSTTGELGDVDVVVAKSASSVLTVTLTDACFALSSACKFTSAKNISLNYKKNITYRKVTTRSS